MRVRRSARTTAGRLARLGGFAALTVLSTTGFAINPPAPAPAALPGPETAVEAVTAVAAGTLAGLGVTEPVPVASREELKGLFRLDPASCGGGAVSGTYFRMIQPGGGADGPYIENNSSACADKTYTDLQPGRDGGLSTMEYQPHPNPAFDAGGNGVADRILQPKGFFGRNFAVATNQTDPQTGSGAPLPTVAHDGAGGLSGNMSAFAAAYGGQHFNQGAPKPDGSNPGNTTGPTGTYDPATRRFVLEWASTIVGGPFNNFTGRWHFEGVFEPTGTGQAPTPATPGEASPPGEGDDGGLLGLPLPIGAAEPRLAPAPGRAAAPDGRIVAGQAGGELQGLFRIEAASCAGGTPSGSYFRMIQPGGTPDGPFLANTSSTCADKTFTDLSPGRDGGISTVGFQPQPDPPFTSEGGSQEGTADRITMPKEFFGSKFATATNPTDPQTNLSTAMVKIVHDGSGKLSGDTRAFAAAYQGQHFNQGAPKPDGSTPGATTPLTGTYDPATKAFTIQWTSTIVGGPFDNFTGLWHFEGNFEPAVAETPAAPVGDTTSGSPVGGSAAPGGSTLAQTGGGGEAAAPVAIARTGPPWPAALPTALLGFALLGRRATRRAGKR